METKFKIGDVVYDSLLFKGEKGEVVKYFEGWEFPVRVKFNNRLYHYKDNGTFIKNNSATPTLSFTPYEFKTKGFSQKIAWMPKEGEIIAVRDEDGEIWKIVTFKKMTGEFYCSDSNRWKLAKSLTDFMHEIK